MMLVPGSTREDGDGNDNVDDNELAKHEECDACPHCNDTCFNPKCESCEEKRRIINEREHDQQSCSLLPVPKIQAQSNSRESLVPSAPASLNTNQGRILKRYYTMCEISRHDGSTSNAGKRNNRNDPQTTTTTTPVIVDGDNNAGSTSSPTSASLWIVAGNKVYDVTEYVQYHPGGPHCFFGKRAGGHQDSLRDLQYHSKLGQRLWSKFHIGYVTKCSSNITQRPENRTKQTISTNDNTTCSLQQEPQPTKQQQWNFQFPSLW